VPGCAIAQRVSRRLCIIVIIVILGNVVEDVKGKPDLRGTA